MSRYTGEYLETIRQEHTRRPSGMRKWGDSGGRNFGPHVLALLERRRSIQTVLDFGAGEGTLGQYVMARVGRDVEWTNYDPGMSGIDTLPTQKFDLIVSSDVLEHIEPEFIDEVLDWMKDHAKSSQYHRIDCAPAGLILPDGRNAHLIVEEPEWWFDKLASRGDVMSKSISWRKTRGSTSKGCTIQIDHPG